ncbi:MAG: hypothetical protein DMG22_17200 [Acidobacteria bacterium]|nr:MAG: hypothetical protein DMG22_17200 [Acidobacteriota bacterium]
MISNRSKLLLCGAALASGSIAVFYIKHRRILAWAEQGDIYIDLKPSPFLQSIFWVGLICMIAGLISILRDLRCGK